MKKKFSFFLVTLCFLSITNAQQKIQGPIVEGFGDTYAVSNPDFEFDTTKIYKVLFDIHAGSNDPTKISPQLNTLARFMNMHVQAGVPRENIHLAGVIHNKASKDAMNNEAYREKYGVDNPNIPLIKALDDAGIDIYMCGQSVYARGIDRGRLADPVKVGLSTMSIIISLEKEGYTLIRF